MMVFSIILMLSRALNTTELLFYCMNTKGMQTENSGDAHHLLAYPHFHCNWYG